MKDTKKWSANLQGFYFLMDLSRIPPEKRLETVKHLQESQKKIVPMTIEEWCW